MAETAPTVPPEVHAQAPEMILRPIDEKLPELQRASASRWLHYACFPIMQVVGIAIIVQVPAIGLQGWSQYAVYAAAILMIALAMNAYFLLLHEAIHGLLAPRPALNRALGVLLATQGMISARSYQVLHMRHHKFLGHPDDPDDYRNYTKNDTLVWLLQLNRLVWATVMYVALLPIMSWRYGSAKDRRAVAEEYALVVVVWAALFWFVPISLVVVCWGIPFLLTNFMINLRGLSQHGSTDAHDPFTASRTVISNPVQRFFLINENYHLEHHLYPSVPADRLPDLHQALNQVLPYRVTHKSYLSYLVDFFKSGPTAEKESLGIRSSDEFKSPSEKGEKGETCRRV